MWCYLRIVDKLSFGLESVACSALLLVACMGCNTLVRQNQDRKNKLSDAGQHKTWRDYGGGPDQSKYVVLDEINKSNVNQLKVTWFYPTGDDKAYQFNPVVVDSIMYVLAKDNSLVALNATTGREIWIHADLQGIAPRGINYWESNNREDRRLIFQMNNYLQAIDARTGKSVLTFGENGLVDLKVGLGRNPETLARVQSGTPGKVFENLILLGSSPGEGYLSGPGHLRGYDVITGKLVWTFHTIPQPGEYGYDTWPKDAYKYIGGVNAWGEISVDTKRGIAYYPLGSPTYDYYGADRIGSNLFANSILALDARTGKRLWHYQLVHHDLWDYDLTAAPQLVTVNHGKKKIDAVAIIGKHGFLFAFDRVSGKPLWPIEERKVPLSDVPGEQAWPTQPFPTVLPPASRQILSSKDLAPTYLTPEQYTAWNSFVTPEERIAWKKRLDTAQTGLFTPLSVRYETVSMPGSTGGTNFGNTAANPGKGLVYVMSQSYPSIYKRLKTKEEILKEESKLVGEGMPVYVKNCQACHGPKGAGLSAPSILHVNQRLEYNDFKQVVVTGKGKMPAFPHLDDNNLRNIYTYLNAGATEARGGNRADKKPVVQSGPLVASGGAPGGQKIRQVPRPGGRFGAPYPEVDTPSTRYYIEGYGLGYPFILPPPWSEIMAYDLNQGTMKWKVPLGKSLGGGSTGLPRGSQRNGMIVTSTGIIFSTARDEKIYAFDADTGKELWSGKLPAGTEGLPSMYEVNGHYYLVVNASTPPIVWDRQSTAAKIKAGAPVHKGGYVVFALPNKLVAH